MSSGVPRSGKNQFTEHVNMASNDVKTQNIPRAGGKTQIPEHGKMPINDQMMQNPVAPRSYGKHHHYDYNAQNVQGTEYRGGMNTNYSERPNMMSQGPGSTQMPHFTTNASVPPASNMPIQNPTNTVIYAHDGSITQNDSNFFTLQMHSQGMNHRQMQPQYNYQMQYNQYNNGQFSFQQQGGYQSPYMHQPSNYQQPMQPPIESQPQPQNLQKRERKILAIVDPTTSVRINEEIGEKPKSNNITPNTTVDDTQEIRKAAIRKEFSQQIGVIHDDKNKPAAPLAQSEPKTETALVEKAEPTVEPIAEETEAVKPSVETTLPPPPQVQPQAVVEPIVREEPVKIVEEPIVREEPVKIVEEPVPVPVMKLEPVDKVTDALEKATIEETTIPEVKSSDHEDEVPSLQVILADSPFISVEVPEGDEEEATSPSPDPEEERRIREEEETENLRLKKIELETKMAEYENEPTECDIETGAYGRSFMYCIRDMEKLFNITNPPVPLEVLRGTYNIDIHSMPKQSDGKQKQRQTDFNPPWAQKGGSTRGGTGKYPGRPSDGRGPRSGGGSGKKYTARPSIDRAPRVQLGNKAENAWKAEKIRNEDLDKEENKIKVLLKAVRSLLNKITPTTKDELTDEFLNLRVSGEPPTFEAPAGQLAQVIEIIFDKAVEEPRFCSIYSEICKRQVDTELRFNKAHSPFRNAILTRSQNTFVLKDLQLDKTTMENETDEEKKKEMAIKIEEEFNKFRRRKFGNINFIGQLYYQQLLSTKIIQWCLHDLLRDTHPDAQRNVPKPPYDEESLLCATQLLEVVGKSLESCNDFQRVTEYVSQIFSHLKGLANQCSPKIKFKIIGIVELRDNRWKQRKVVDQGPKKITEIHQEAHQEQQQKQQERDAYDRKLGQGVRTGSSSLRRNNPPPARNSFDSRVNSTQNKRAAAGTASKLVTTSAQPRNMSMSLSGNSGSKRNWQRGAAGGGTSGGEGPGSRTIIQRNSGSREGSESRKNSMATEREASLQAARDIGAGNLPPRSSSQMSVASQEGREENDEEKEAKQSKIARRVCTLFDEYSNDEIKENELVEDLLKVQNHDNYGSPDLSEVFQRYIQTYIQEQYSKKEKLRDVARSILMSFLAEPKRKDVLKGIEQFSKWAVRMEMWEDNPKVWEDLSELLTYMLSPPPEPIIDADGAEIKVFSLEELSPVFNAANEDDRPNKLYFLLIFTVKNLAEQIAINNSEHLAGLVWNFEELSCRKKMDKAKLDAALKACSLEVQGYSDLYALLHQN